MVSCIFSGVLLHLHSMVDLQFPRGSPFCLVGCLSGSQVNNIAGCAVKQRKDHNIDHIESHQVSWIVGHAAVSRETTIS